MARKFAQRHQPGRADPPSPNGALRAPSRETELVRLLLATADDADRRAPIQETFSEGLVAFDRLSIGSPCCTRFAGRGCSTASSAKLEPTARRRSLPGTCTRFARQARQCPEPLSARKSQRACVDTAGANPQHQRLLWVGLAPRSPDLILTKPLRHPSRGEDGF